MSKSLATKNVAAVLLAASMIFGVMFAFATPARAQTLESLQAQIQALLAQIAALQGGSVPSASCTTFTRNHQQGQSGGEIMAIQKFLNSNGAQIAASGAGSPGNETSYFGSLTRAAVSKFQAANGISPTAGYWGPITRAKANSMCTGTPGVPGVPITGNGLKVMLSADSPVNVALVQGQAVGELGKFTFQNPTGSTVTVTNLAFMRIGVSNDSTLTNVYLYDGVARLTDAAGVSNSAFNFNDPSGVFTLAPGQSRNISVRADIAGSTSGQQVGVQLTSVAASGALDTTVVLPITGGIQTVSAATLATADFGATTLPSSATVAPQNDYVLWQNTVTIGTRAVNLQSFQLRNVGSTAVSDIKNLRLYVDGVQVGNAIAQLSSGEASVYWDLSATAKRLETGGRVIKVVGDIVGGSSLTFQFSLRRAGDARMVDTDLNQPILATANGSAFTARSATSATIDSGTVSTVKANNSPSSNVTLGGSNVKFATFEMRAAGENVKVESLDVQANTTLDHGLDNGKVFLNGVQVGSTKDLTDATDVNFTFGSSFILKAGETAIIDIYADAKSTTGAAFASGDTAAITLGTGSSNAQGQVSLTTLNTPTADVTANTLTISSSSLTVSKASGYGNQTMIAGTNNAKLGSFTISAGATEGLNINTIVINLSSVEAASITDLRLVDSSTGAQIGNTKATPSSGDSADNSFAVNINIPASNSKTIDVVGNIKSSANAGTWIAAVDTSTGGTGLTTGTSVTAGSTVALQTITVGSGTLTVARDGGTPANVNVLAGSSQVHVGKFDFAAANSSFTVQELRVKIPSDAATSVSNVTLKYKDSTGTTQTVNGSLTLPTSPETHATATFTGLTMYVPQNGSADLDVYVDVTALTSGGKSGAAISVLLDADEGFKAIDAGGTSDTSLATSDANSASSSGYGTMYVKASVPTLTRLSTGYTQNTVAAGIGLYRFTVSADQAGAIDWREISLTITTTGVTVTDLTLYDVTSGTAIAVNDTVVNGSPFSFCPDTSCTVGEAEEVGAGSSKTYEIRAGTVTGWGASGDDITMYFTEDTSAITNAAAASVSANMTWSDRSATSHSTTTTDWTNGYLVKDVSSDVRQCQFGTVTTCTP